MACGPRSQVSFAAEAMTAAVMPPVAELAEVVIVAQTFGLYLRVSAVLGGVPLDEPPRRGCARILLVNDRDVASISAGILQEARLG